MKRFYAIICFVCSIFVSSLEAQIAGGLPELIRDVHPVWEVQDDMLKRHVFLGEEYFGVSPSPYGRGNENYVYRHYSMKGELMWSSEIIDGLLEVTGISRSGNRICALAKSGPAGRGGFVTQVFDETGNFLFAGPYQYSLRSSPTGKYFFSPLNVERPGDFVALDEKGKVLHDRGYSALAIDCIDDSSLVILAVGELLTLNVWSNTVTHRRVHQPAWALVNLDYAPEPRRILVWSETQPGNGVLVLDLNLEEISRIDLSDLLEFVDVVDISNDGNLVALLALRAGSDEDSVTQLLQVFDIAGNQLLETEHFTAPGESRGLNLGDDLSFGDSQLIVRYTPGFNFRSQPVPYRSAVFSVVPAGASFVLKGFLEAWLFPVGSGTRFLELDGESIKLHSR